MIIRSICFFYPICLLIILTSCKIQDKSGENITHKNPDTEGLTTATMDQSIWVIFQDRNNNYWWGSNGSGVYRYDSNEIVQITTNEGLVSNQIRGIQEDQSGNIYFDTPTGVNRWNGQEITLLHPVPSTQWKIGENDLWFKGNGAMEGVYRLARDTLFQLKFTDFGDESLVPDRYNTMSPYGVYSIYQDKAGHMWMGTLAAGVCHFDGTYFHWIFEKELSVLENGRVPGIRSIIEDKKGYFWLSHTLHRYQISTSDPTTDDSAFQYQKLDGIASKDGDLSMAFPYFTSAVIDAETGDLWMSTYGQGIWKYNGERLQNFLLGYENKKVNILSLYNDNDGKLWVGTDNAGLYLYNGTSFVKFNFP